MKTKHLIFSTLLFGALVVSPFASVCALDSKDSKDVTREVNPLTAQQKETHIEAQKLIGEISLTSLALDLKLKEDAKGHLKKATTLANTLENSAPTWKSSTTFKYGKVSYNLKNEDKDYYMPISEDLAVIRDYEPVFHYFSDADIEETDAQLMHSTVYLNLREVKNALSKASTDIDADKLESASEDLIKVYKGAITDTDEIESPTWAVYDNLALAKNMIELKRYDSARHALKYAKQGLKDLKSDGATSMAATKIDAEIATIQTELKQKDPGTLAIMKQKVKGWMKTVKSWL